MTEILSDRALNRATLARQMLLARAPLPTLAAVGHLVGLQAQNPLDPYLALWSRLTGFDPHDLGRDLEERRAARVVAMRGTIHLLTADDAVALPPLMQPVLDAEIARHSEFAPLLRDVDVRPVVAYAAEVLAERPSTTARLRAALAERFPDVPAAAAAYATRCLVPLVQVPPRGVWGRTSQVTLTPVTTWLAGHPAPTVTLDDVVLRYLAAFGPATVADIAAWCRLTGLRPVVDGLSPRLRTFADERGRTLHDVPDGPLPDPDVPAPVRFLPEYDNALLSFADRSRFASDDDRRRLARAAGPFKGSVLVDGRVRGIWHPEPAPGRRRTVVVDHLGLDPTEADDVHAEARAMGRFWLGDGTPDGADVDVRLVAIA